MFFFFKQKTAYEMRISDWSSDVCSSDLADFLPGQLELARALFENHKDREAHRAFQAAHTLLAEQGDQAVNVRQTVDAFLHALEQRRGWQGRIAVGPTYSTNLNQSSDSYTCLLEANAVTCLFDRTIPDPLAAPGFNRQEER